jgi:hypothetical protein
MAQFSLANYSLFGGQPRCVPVWKHTSLHHYLVEAAFQCSQILGVKFKLEYLTRVSVLQLYLQEGKHFVQGVQADVTIGTVRICRNSPVFGKRSLEILMGTQSVFYFLHI